MSHYPPVQNGSQPPNTPSHGHFVPPNMSHYPIDASAPGFNTNTGSVAPQAPVRPNQAAHGGLNYPTNVHQLQVNASNAAWQDQEANLRLLSTQSMPAMSGSSSFASLSATPATTTDASLKKAIIAYSKSFIITKNLWPGVPAGALAMAVPNAATETSRVYRELHAHFPQNLWPNEADLAAKKKFFNDVNKQQDSLRGTFKILRNYSTTIFSTLLTNGLVTADDLVHIRDPAKRRSSPSLLALLGYQPTGLTPEDKWPIVCPLVFPAGQPAFSSEAIKKVLIGILHGPTKISTTGFAPSTNSNVTLWNVTAITPEVIALATTVTKWIISEQESFTSKPDQGMNLPAQYQACITYLKAAENKVATALLLQEYNEAVLGRPPPGSATTTTTTTTDQDMSPQAVFGRQLAQYHPNPSNSELAPAPASTSASSPSIIANSLSTASTPAPPSLTSPSTPTEDDETPLTPLPHHHLLPRMGGENEEDDDVEENNEVEENDEGEQEGGVEKDGNDDDEPLTNVYVGTNIKPSKRRPAANNKASGRGRGQGRRRGRGRGRGGVTVPAVRGKGKRGKTAASKDGGYTAGTSSTPAPKARTTRSNATSAAPM